MLNFGLKLGNFLLTFNVVIFLPKLVCSGSNMKVYNVINIAATWVDHLMPLMHNALSLTSSLASRTFFPHVVLFWIIDRHTRSYMDALFSRPSSRSCSIFLRNLDCTLVWSSLLHGQTTAPSLHFILSNLFFERLEITCS